MESKLIFKYGTMHSSKSAQLLMEAHNYKMQGKSVIAIKPSLDTRGEQGKITSRTPLNPLDCYEVPLEMDLFFFLENNVRLKSTHVILIDEAQFLTSKQVEQLYKIRIKHQITILAYGLKNSYIPGELFPGSASLLYYADEIEEIKTACQKCNKKATQNLRSIDGKPVYDGEQIKIGDIKGKESYAQVCGYHYFESLL